MDGMWLAWRCTWCALRGMWTVLSVPLHTDPFLPFPEIQGLEGSGHQDITEMLVGV